MKNRRDEKAQHSVPLESTHNPITQLLAAAAEGQDDAREKLWHTIYDELRAVARNQCQYDPPGRGPHPTTLVHETYIRLVGEKCDREWANRKEFFAAAARAMRAIRIDDARTRGRLKRGGGKRPASLVESSDVADRKSDAESSAEELLALDEALKKLEHQDPRKAEIVNLRYFAGLTQKEIAGVLGLSLRTVVQEWRIARVWLHRELSGE